MTTVTKINEDEPENSYTAQSNAKVKEALEMLFKELNGGNRQQIANTIYQTISREHRTLQQALWSVLLQAQIRYADNPHDLRNDASVELAQLVRETAKAHNLDYGLPYI